MTREELTAIVTAAVNAALDERASRNKKDIIITRRATAERLGVDYSTLWRWAKIGYLTPIHRGGRVWYAESEIERIEKGESPE